MSEPMNVWRAGRNDIAGAAAAFAAATQGEAVITWVIPDQDERHERIVRDPEAAERWIGAVVATGEVVVAGTGPDEVAGVSLWEFIDPTSTTGDRSIAAGSQDEADAAMAAAFDSVYGPYASRMATVRRMTEERHPNGEPHWYLQQMGVRPDHRGRGVGGALLRHQLARIDETGRPVYLEASSPRAAALYERHGFRALGEPIVLPEDGPRLRPMWRPVGG
ncbi:GNAT family N-acetyltransferase [Actinoalloteichus spitiensis]|uniref:GNAT family N-acetyltransferase n=1 Tax=Actinoalloteichus spitiensis TaxID=252394 RepID=UPI00037F1821|nr:GNAT family N-acetyltransferase [Actinoalloteichus spitiensis]